MDRYYHYVEIGTSNFRTLVGTQPPEQYGISVEPMPFFVRELRERYAWSHPNAKIINAAVLPKALGETHVVNAFYIHPENITSWNLPSAFLGMSRMGSPHPSVSSYLEERNWMHLLQTRPVRSMSLPQLLDLQRACRIGFLKLDVEGFDHELIQDYVAYLWQRPECWSDGLEYEVHPAFSIGQQSLDLLQSLSALGYYENGIQKLEVADVPGGNRTYTIRLVYARTRDSRHNLATLTWPAEVPKVVHMLLPCFFSKPLNCTFDSESDTQLLRWQHALPDDWHVELWTPYTLVAALHGHEPERWPALLGVNPKYEGHKMPHFNAKYHLLAYFGGIFVDWSLHPRNARELIEAQAAAQQTGVWCLNPGPSGLRSSSGSLLAAAAFHPTMQLMGLEMPNQGLKRQDAQISLSEVELYLLKSYYQLWSGEELTCPRANLTRRRTILA